MNTIKTVALLMFVFFTSGNAFAAKKPAVEAPMAPPSKASMMFYTAATNKNYEMMDTYLARGADINCGNCDSAMPPLARSLSQGILDPELTAYLVKHGANVNLLTQGKLTPLMFVLDNGTWSSNYKPNLDAMLQLVPFLVANGADVTLTNSNGKNALFFLIGHGYSSAETMKVSMQLMRFLVDKGTDVNHQIHDGTTALMFAAGGCGIASVQHLLFLHANPKLKNALGETALSIAEDAAARSRSGSSCNQVVAMLRNPEQFAIDPLSNSDVIGADMPARSDETYPVDSYAGTYGGTFSGDDDGNFQAVILQDGTATSTGHSNKYGATFTATGKVNNAGFVSLGSTSTGAEFSGTISREGVLTGTWKNTPQKEAGSFKGNKGVQVTIPPTDTLKVIGSIFGGLFKKPQ